ncbi:MAG: hypothetical protein Q7S24_00195 [bacterium]|nr:hypothetical protein [bacterium]
MPDDEGVKKETKVGQNNTPKPAPAGGSPAIIRDISVSESGGVKIGAKNLGSGKLEIVVESPNVQNAILSANTPAIPPNTPPVASASTPSDDVVPTATIPPPSPTPTDEQPQPNTEPGKNLQNNAVAPTDQIPPAPSAEQPPTNRNTPTGNQTPTPETPPQPPNQNNPPSQNPQQSANPPANVPPANSPTKPNQGETTNKPDPAAMANQINQAKNTNRKNNRSTNISGTNKPTLPTRAKKNTFSNNINNTANSIGSDKAKQRNLLRISERITRKIDKEMGRDQKKNTSNAMKWISWIFPALANLIMALKESKFDKNIAKRVKQMESHIAKIKAMLKTLKFVAILAAIYDSSVETYLLCVPITLGIVPFTILLGIIVGVFTVPFFSVQHLVGVPGTVGRAVKLIAKDFKSDLKWYNELYRLDLKKLKKIQKLINQRKEVRGMISSLNRGENIRTNQNPQPNNQQPANDDQEQPDNTEDQPANDNYEENPGYAQAA